MQEKLMNSFYVLWSRGSAAEINQYSNKKFLTLNIVIKL